MDLSSLNLNLKEWTSVFHDTFWNPGFWLPEGVTWADLEMPNKYGLRIAQVSDLIIPFLFAPGLLLLRYFVERYFLHPIGLYFGISDQPGTTKQSMILENTTLEKIWTDSKGQMSKIKLDEVAKSSGKSKEFLKRYFRNKLQVQGRPPRVIPSKLTKFKESAWKTLWYTCSFSFGFYVSYNKPWFWDITECWKGYPFHDLTQDLWSYYMLGLSYYISITISQFTDVQRKDFKEMLVHHIATIWLMSMSFTANALRFGSMILLLHDGADILLEFSKALSYAKFHVTKLVVFGVFVVVWFVTRLYLFPCHLIWSAMFECPEYMSRPPSYLVMTAFMVLLFFLHCYWTFYIFKVIFNGIMVGGEPKDGRSDDEDDDDELDGDEGQERGGPGPSGDE